MSSVSGFRFIHRPYPYERSPFKVAEGEAVPFRDVFFSRPAYGLLADKRLFTESNVSSSINLYINKDANSFSTIEPRLDGSGYSQATPHYADYITDLRSLLSEVTTAHAADSDHSANDFFRSHMERNRDSVYDMDNSSASGTSASDYTHDLDNHYLEDIDMDEVMWQPFPRPSKGAVAGGRMGNMPSEPIFPMALPGGNAPSATAPDIELFSSMALNPASSGGVLVTGDALTPGTVISLVDASGVVAATVGTHNQNIDWKLFPGQEYMDSYGYDEFVEDKQVGCVTASGRQAIYNNPGSSQSDVVLMLNVATPGTSGYVVSNWPSNYHATSGVDANGTAHDGVHIIDRVIINAMPGAGTMAAGRSPVNGKLVFGHVRESDITDDDGHTAVGQYKDGSVIRGRIGKIAQNGRDSATHKYSATEEDLSSHSFSTQTTDRFSPRQVNVFGPPIYGEELYLIEQQAAGGIYPSIIGNIYNNIYHSCSHPGQPDGKGFEKTQQTLTYTVEVYHAVQDPNNPLARDWTLVDTYNGTSTIKWTENLYSLVNMYYAMKQYANHGLRALDGQVFFQWNSVPRGAFGVALPGHDRRDLLRNFSTATRNRRNVPEQLVTETQSVISSWRSPTVVYRLQRVTYDGAANIPDTLSFQPDIQIHFAADLPWTLDDVYQFGPVIDDDVAGGGYVYFQRSADGGISPMQDQYYFCKLDGTAEISHVNRVDAEDAIMTGSPMTLRI